MQTKKMSLANIKGKLSRAEMKSVMAGSGGCLAEYSYACSSSSNCCSGLTCESNATNTGTICMQSRSGGGTGTLVPIVNRMG